MPRKRRPAAVQPKDVTRESEHETQHEKFSPRTREQASLVKLIHNNDLIFVSGVAGSGKSAVSSAMAADYFLRGLVDKIIISRPIVSAEANLGILPGEIENKTDPYLQPLFIQLSPFIDVRKAIAHGQIQVIPVGFMRGLTFINSFIVIDEAENLTMHQLKLVVTRFGENSKMILNGDTTQSDLCHYHQNDFADFIKRVEPLSLNPDNRIGIADLKQSVRHPLVQTILSVF